jgi:hypothetical protein
MKARRGPALAVVAMLLVVGGCSSTSDDDGSTGGSGTTDTTSAGKNAPSPSPAPSDLPTDQETLTTSEGGTVSTSGELPDGFPEDVRIVEGTVLSSTTADDDFNVSLIHDGGVKSTYTDALRRLTKAGFDIEKERTAPGARFARLARPGMQIEVSVIEVGPKQCSVTYFVTST